jgi:hypothetical protein
VCYHNASLQAFLVRQVQAILTARPDFPWLSVTQNDSAFAASCICSFFLARLLGCSP